MLKAQELREKSQPELEKLLRDQRHELLQARLSKQTGQLERPHVITQTRRDIARLETELTHKRRQALA